MRRYEVSTDGTTITTFSYTNAAKGEDGYATINFTITGNFVDTPNVRAACEGNWISGTVTCNPPTNNGRTVTGSVEVKPTTAYVGDERKGKLSLYVPYYGATGIGQIDLTAAGSTNIGLSGTDRGMQILEKSAEETEATVTFSLDEGGSAPSSSGPCKLAFDFDYTLTNTIEENGVRVETGNGFSNTYKANGWLGAGACTYDASTKTYTQKIDLTYNMDTEKSRTAAVIVYSPSGREVTRFVIEQDKLEEPENPDVPVIDNIPITKLVPSGNDAANCYIITGPGRYELPAYKGAYKAAQLTDDKKCEGRPVEVWNDNSANVIEFFQKDLADSKILIDINPTKTNGKVTGHSGAVSNGNAVVAVKGDDGKILWSWHLWFCPNGAPGTQTYPAGSDSKVYKLMDRNLGATISPTIDLLSNTLTYWQDGLFYQWGRKDPIRLDAAKKNANTEKYADVQFDPNWNASDSWTASKSVTDPCPPGYKVPSSDVWREGESDGTMELLTKYTLTDVYPYEVVSDNIPAAVVYPYLGYINNSGSKINGTASTSSSEGTSTATDYPIIGKVYTLISPNKADIGYDTEPSYPPVRFDEVTYRNQDIEVSSYLWTSSTENAIQYGYTSKGKEIVSYKYQVGEWKRSTSYDWVNGKLQKVTVYRANWTGGWSALIEGQYDKDTNEWNDKLDDIFDTYGGIRRTDIFDILNLGQILNRKFLYDKTTNNVKSANPVRCVAE